MIASIGPGLPQDLFAATGRYAGSLRYVAGRSTPKGDRWLESKFAPWARAIVEDWAEGAFGQIETIVFSRADDSAQRLYYYVCELQRTNDIAGPQPILLDIAKIGRPSSVDHTMASVRDLASRLGVDDKALEAAIVATNRTRTAQSRTLADPVCLLVGTPPPDRRLHDAISAVGYSPSGMTLPEFWADPGPPVAEGSGDPIAAIARQLHARPDGQRGFENQAQEVLSEFRATGARAAVMWYTEEDEARVWNVPAIRSGLAEAQVPTLVLTRRDWLARDGATGEIDNFLKGLGR